MVEFSMLLRFFIDIMENKRKFRADPDLKLIKGDILNFLRSAFCQLIIDLAVNYLAAPLQKVSNPGSTISKTPE